VKPPRLPTVANQINRARKVAERLGKTHDVPYAVLSLSLEQHGANQPFLPAQVAALLAGEGVYLVAQLAEYPQLIPALSPKVARAIGRRVTRRLRSPDADRPSLFLADALLRYCEFSYAEASDERMVRAISAGRDVLAAHYPLPETDRDQLNACATAFAARQECVARHASTRVQLRAAGLRREGHGTRLGTSVGPQLGHSVSADLAFMAVPNPDGMARLLALTQVWGDYAGRSARLLSGSR
jgi:hypothetical protein